MFMRLEMAFFTLKIQRGKTAAGTAGLTLGAFGLLGGWLGLLRGFGRRRGNQPFHGIFKA